MLQHVLRSGVITAMMTLMISVCLTPTAAHAATVGEGDATLTLASRKAPVNAVIVITPEAAATDVAATQRGRSVSPGLFQHKAAADLARFIGMMTGDKPTITSDASTAGNKPAIFIGDAALKAKPALQQKLNRVKKQTPTLRADAIVAQRDDSRLYLAGSNEESHYHAASWLLHQLGCRWYIPTEIGQHIPEHDEVAVGKLDHTYAPPFEIRHYWIAWNGSQEGYNDFVYRNFMHHESVPTGHRLAKYTGDLVPEGKTHYSVPIAEPQVAEHVARKLEPAFKAGERIMLGMEDGIYNLESELDRELHAGVWDKYFLVPTLTDPFMVFYNQVSENLLKKFPDSNAKIGFLAYSNITLPPQRDITAAKPLIAYLAPIDIDPNHGMDDPQSPPRQEYKGMMYRWAKVMEGRLGIYDYDQGMLVWRDIPNPSHQAFRHDVKHYRDAGILGIDTESRNAIATVWLNLFLRGQLMWDPEADVDAEIEQFYTNFYGPAAEPMGKYWDAIFKAWDDTIVTEHEYFAAPAIYTPQLVSELRGYMAEAGQLANSIRVQGRSLSDREQLVLDRLALAQAQWRLLDLYTTMAHAAATDADYARASEVGQALIAARLEMAKINPTLTTRVVGPAAEPTEPKGSPAWMPGEVAQYMRTAALMDGTEGKLVKKLPLEWAFHRDPHDTGLPRNWFTKDADLSYWNAHKDEYDLDSLRNYPTTEWEMIRTDLYAQAQGVRHPDRQSFTGYMWYKTNVELTAAEAGGGVHINFPGLFNTVWLYVNGELVDYRPQKDMWWKNSYAFQWDVDLSGHLKAGKNDITIRAHNPHHFGGMFRRPFLYRPVE